MLRPWPTPGILNRYANNMVRSWENYREEANFALSLFAMLKIIQTNTYGFQISFFLLCISTLFIQQFKLQILRSHDFQYFFSKINYRSNKWQCRSVAAPLRNHAKGNFLLDCNSLRWLKIIWILAAPFIGTDKVFNTFFLQKNKNILL